MSARTRKHRLLALLLSLCMALSVMSGIAAVAMAEGEANQYQVVIWVENADDNEYSIHASTYVELPAGTDIKGAIEDTDSSLWSKIGDAFKKSFGTVNIENPVSESVFFHIAKENGVPKYEVWNGAVEGGKVVQKTDSTVLDDKGESVINVYYDRNVYTLDFTYYRAVKQDGNGHPAILYDPDGGTDYKEYYVIGFRGHNNYDLVYLEPVYSGYDPIWGDWSNPNNPIPNSKDVEFESLPAAFVEPQAGDPVLYQITTLANSNNLGNAPMQISHNIYERPGKYNYKFYYYYHDPEPLMQLVSGNLWRTVAKAAGTYTPGEDLAGAYETDETKLPSDYTIKAKYGADISALWPDNYNQLPTLSAHPEYWDTRYNYEKPGSWTLSQGTVTTTTYETGAWVPLVGELCDRYVNHYESSTSTDFTDNLVHNNQLSNILSNPRTMSALLIADPANPSVHQQFVHAWDTGRHHVYNYHYYEDVGVLDDADGDGWYTEGEKIEWYGDYTPGTDDLASLFDDNTLRAYKNGNSVKVYRQFDEETGIESPGVSMHQVAPYFEHYTLLNDMAAAFDKYTTYNVDWFDKNGQYWTATLGWTSTWLSGQFPDGGNGHNYTDADVIRCF